MKKEQKILIIFIILTIIFKTNMLARTSEYIEETKGVGNHIVTDEVGNDYYLDNFIQGDFETYYRQGEEYSLTFKGETYNEALNFITIKDDIFGVKANTVIFCIQPDQLAITIDDVDQSNSYYNNLDNEQKLNVSETVAISTQRFAATGNYDYLAAGQLLVWEAVGSVINSTPKVIDGELEELRQLKNEYEMLPSFVTGGDTDLELTYNKENQRYEIYLEDTNNILDKHFLKGLIGVENGFHIEDGPKDDDLLIWAENPPTIFTQVINATYNPMPIPGERSGIKYTSAPLFINSGQDLVSGLSKDIKIEFKLHIKEALGSAILNKCGYIEETCEPLAGAEFTLYDEDNKIIDKQMTNELGQITFKNISLGKYYVLETTAPKGYEINDEKFEFSITEDKEKVAINSGQAIEDEKIKGTVSLKKVGIKSNSDNTLYPLEGVEFKIYKDENENGVVDENEKVEQVLQTDEVGEIHSAYLECGDYIIKETQAREGYINNGYEESFVIESSENIELLGGMDLVNDIKKGKVDLIKHGEELCEEDGCETHPLAGVKFIIYQDSNENKKLDEADEAIQTLTTSEDGYAISGDLIYGNYFIQEKETVEGYKLSDEVFPFSIVEDESVEHLNNGEPIINKLQTNYIEVLKLDQFDSSINGVEFTIYEDVNLNNKIDDEDKKVDTFLTDEKGIGKSGALKYGNYILKETKTPLGYIMSDKEYLFTINEETLNEPVQYEIYNELILADLQIIKRDNDDNSLLAGVKFELYKDMNENDKLEEEDELVGEYITDEAGEINIKELPYGKYILKETEPLEDYYNNKDLYFINIDGTKDKYSLEIYNQKKATEIIDHLVYTARGNKKKVMFSILVIISLLIIFIKLKKENKNYI